MPKLTESEYATLKTQILREKLAQAGHPVPGPQRLPLPPPYQAPGGPHRTDSFTGHCSPTCLMRAAFPCLQHPERPGCGWVTLL